MDISNSVRTTPRTSNGGESDQNWCLLSLLAQEVGSSDVGPVCVALEVSMSCGTPCVNSAFFATFKSATDRDSKRTIWSLTWNPLMIESLDLRPHHEVLHDRWTSVSNLQAGPVIHRRSGIGGHPGIAVVDHELVQKPVVSGNVLLRSVGLVISGALVQLRIHIRTSDGIGDQRCRQERGEEERASHVGDAVIGLPVAKLRR